MSTVNTHISVHGIETITILKDENGSTHWTRIICVDTNGHAVTLDAFDVSDTNRANIVFVHPENKTANETDILNP